MPVGQQSPNFLAIGPIYLLYNAIVLDMSLKHSGMKK